MLSASPLVLCLEFVVEHLVVHGGAEDGGGQPQRDIASTLPVVAACLGDFEPVVIQALAGQVYTADSSGSCIDFGGRGKAMLFTLSEPEVRSWLQRAPLWLLALAQAAGEEDPASPGLAGIPVIASACLDLAATVAHAVATAGQRSGDPGSGGMPGVDEAEAARAAGYVRAAVDLVATSGDGASFATLHYALRAAAISDEGRSTLPADGIAPALPLAAAVRVGPRVSEGGGAADDPFVMDELVVRRGAKHASPGHASDPLSNRPRAGEVRLESPIAAFAAAPMSTPRMRVSLESRYLGGTAAIFADELLVRQPAPPSGTPALVAPATEADGTGAVDSPAPPAALEGFDAGGGRSSDAPIAALDAPEPAEPPTALLLAAEMTRELLEASAEG